MGTLEVLAELEGWFRQNQHPILQVLQPGLEESEINRLMADWPYRLPEEVHALYRWHNGVSERHVNFFPNHTFYPLAESLEIAKRYREAAPMFNQPEDGYWYWKSAWLPIFGDFYAQALILTVGSSEPEGSAPVLDFFNEVPEKPVLYGSLEALLQVILECYRQGAYRVQAGGQVEVDSEAAWAIGVKHGLKKAKPAPPPKGPDIEETRNPDGSTERIIRYTPDHHLVHHFDPEGRFVGSEEYVSHQLVSKVTWEYLSPQVVRIRQEMTSDLGGMLESTVSEQVRELDEDGNVKPLQ